MKQHRWAYFVAATLVGLTSITTVSEAARPTAKAEAKAKQKKSPEPPRQTPWAYGELVQGGLAACTDIDNPFMSLVTLHNEIVEFCIVNDTRGLRFNLDAVSSSIHCKPFDEGLQDVCDFEMIVPRRGFFYPVISRQTMREPTRWTWSGRIAPDFETTMRNRAKVFLKLYFGGRGTHPIEVDFKDLDMDRVSTSAPSAQTKKN